MASIDSFFPYIQPDITSCPNGLVRNALVMSAIEFCKGSLAWNELQDPIVLVDSVNRYDIDIPNGAQLVGLINLWGPSRELTPKTLNEITQVLPNWQTAQGNTPIVYTQPSPTEVMVFPIPINSLGASLTPRAAYAPLPTASTLPDILLSRYVDAVAAGAKARLMRMSKQPWSDPASAAAFHQDFLTEIDKARIEVLHEFVQGSLSVVPRKFG